MSLSHVHTHCACPFLATNDDSLHMIVTDPSYTDKDGKYKPFRINMFGDAVSEEVMLANSKINRLYQKDPDDLPCIMRVHRMRIDQWQEKLTGTASGRWGASYVLIPRGDVPTEPFFVRRKA